MTEVILANINPQETRVVVVAAGEVQDIHIEREGSRGILGNIYSAKVVRVLPGMQVAFVDFGAQRNGLVRVADLAGPERRKPGRRERKPTAIEKRLHPGQKLLVQVSRDPLGSKGARLTTELTLSSRFLVFLPRSTSLAVSQRVDNPGERTRLLLLLQEGLAAEGLEGRGGYILRTAAEGVALEELRADLRFLKRLWEVVGRKSQQATGPTLLYEELPLHLRIARDLAGPDLDRVVIDDHAAFLALRGFCEEYVPELSDRLQHHSGVAPLFDTYGAEAEIQRALARRVELECGGYLLIDQAEAMTTIDVNTGAFVGKRNVDETIFETNLEAAVTLARQLRLRNLGGIIVVDFIDMTDQGHRQKVTSALQEALQQDPVRTTFNGMSELGLVAMTRRRSGESLQHILCENCPDCHGAGILKSAHTVCYEIYREIKRTASLSEKPEVLVVAADAVANLLQGDEAAQLADIESASGKTIRVRPEPRYPREHFDIAML